MLPHVHRSLLPLVVWGPYCKQFFSRWVAWTSSCGAPLEARSILQHQAAPHTVIYIYMFSGKRVKHIGGRHCPMQPEMFNSYMLHAFRTYGRQGKL